MNHRPFSDWLLSEHELSPDQAQSLQEHLLTCESCRQVQVAWSDVELKFKNVPLVNPFPGFTERWQVYFTNYETRKQKIQGWIPIGITMPIVLILMLISASQVWLMVKNPGPYLAALFSRLVDLLSIYNSMKHLFNPINWEISIYTFIAIFFLVGITSFMCVLWLAAYRKLSMARRLI